MCVDNEKTLKFYNFVDKVAQAKERNFEEQILKFQESVVPFFKTIDLDRNGQLDIEETKPLLNHFIQKYEQQHEMQLSENERIKMEEELFDEMDMDGSGTIDFHEMKVFLTKKYDQMFRK